MPPERAHSLFTRRSSSQSRSLTQKSQASQLSQTLSQQSSIDDGDIPGVSVSVSQPKKNETT
jgi:hypothetical protein